jgi:hypothetical protein
MNAGPPGVKMPSSIFARGVVLITNGCVRGRNLVAARVGCGLDSVCLVGIACCSAVKTPPLALPEYGEGDLVGRNRSRGLRTLAINCHAVGIKKKRLLRGIRPRTGQPQKTFIRDLPAMETLCLAR